MCFLPKLHKDLNKSGDLRWLWLCNTLVQTTYFNSFYFQIAYKKVFEESKSHFHLPMDMINLRHAKKAQALASDLDYRKRLHEYTVVPEDMKTKWAKKAYGLQSDVR